MDYTFFGRFPFLHGAEKLIPEVKTEEILELGEEKAKEIFETKKWVFTAPEGKDGCVKEVKAYLGLRILLTPAGMYFQRKFAQYYAKRAIALLQPGEDLVLLDFLGFRYSLGENAIVFPLEEYLKVHPTDNRLRLVNRKVSEGKVYLERELLPAYLEAAIFGKLVIFPKPTELQPEIIERGKQLVAKYSNFEVKGISGPINFEAFPPCIKMIISQIMSGTKPTHMANFQLATFLIHVGMPKEKILEIFSKMQGFNEKIARYQIEFLAGERGRGVKYLPLSCEKARALGLCPSPCPNTTHPLQYYRREVKKWMRKKQRESSKDTSESTTQA